MVPARKKQPKRPPRSWPGAVIDNTGDEPTLVGGERVEDLSRRKVVFEREQHQRHRMQDKTVVGLRMLLAEVLILGSLAMIGVAAERFEATFAVQVLAITLPPSFAAWLIVVRWAFRRGRSD